MADKKSNGVIDIISLRSEIDSLKKFIKSKADNNFSENFSLKEKLKIIKRFGSNEGFSIRKLFKASIFGLTLLGFIMSIFAGGIIMGMLALFLLASSFFLNKLIDLTSFELCRDSILT